MLKRFLLLVIFLFNSTVAAHAQEIFEVDETFFRGRVLEVGDVLVQDNIGFQPGLRSVVVETDPASNMPKVLEVQQSINLDNDSDHLAVEVGDEILLVKTGFENEVRYGIHDVYRLNGIVFFCLIFVGLVFFVARKKGLWSLLGLLITFFILVNFLAPRLLAGADPIITSFIAAVLIAFVTFYLAHGFKRRTTLALMSTLATLILAFLLSIIAVSTLQLFGTGTEEAISLTFGGLVSIDLRGLLLGAIVIGTLGMLDDITVTQIATVHQIHKADADLNFSELYKRGLSVGRDHIASIINTLVLAYAGASFPILLLLVQSPRPFWVSLNSEFLAEEVVRTLVGSMTLIIAVPIATALAAYFYGRRQH